ncbi:substrate-binding periplasmic protein [Kiloniella sp. b19]|uniref:substrate-binding periplasmic protein n=1 Tax=Kiloniella sp. GXU_MW_B19 TaxID=3141326 RepID=UPI0031E31094
MILYADDSYPPYSFERNNRSDGLYVRILEEASRRLESFEIVFRPVPWKRALVRMQLGKGVGMVPPYYHPEKRPFLTHYSVPILSEITVVVCRRGIVDSRRLDHYPLDYRGLKFVNNSGYLVGGDHFLSMVERGEILLEEAPSTRMNLKKLLARRADCYVNDRLNIQVAIRDLLDAGLITEREAARFVEVDIVSVENGYVGYSALASQSFPYQAEFIRELDRVLMEMRTTGKIRIIREAYLRGKRTAGVQQEQD